MYEVQRKLLIFVTILVISLNISIRPSIQNLSGDMTECGVRTLLCFNINSLRVERLGLTYFFECVLVQIQRIVSHVLLCVNPLCCKEDCNT